MNLPKAATDAEAAAQVTLMPVGNVKQCVYER